MICPNCGTECKSGVFCRICGAKLPTEPPVQNVPQAPAEPQIPDVPEVPEAPAAPETPYDSYNSQKTTVLSADPTVHNDYWEKAAANYRAAQAAASGAAANVGGQIPTAQSANGYNPQNSGYQTVPGNGQPSYNPNGQPGYNPNGQPGYNPNGQPGYNPNGQPGYNPNGQPGYSPNGQMSYNPNGQMGGNPNYQPAYNPNGPVRTYQPPAGGQQAQPGAAVKVVRKLSTSALYLIAVIAFTAAMVLSGLSMYKFMKDPLQLQALQIQGFEMPQIFRQEDILVTLICSLLPGALLALGLWLHFGASVSKGTRMSTAGLTIIKVLLIIFQVLLAICFLAALALLILLMVAGESFLNKFGYTLGDVFRQFPDLKSAFGILIAILVVFYVFFCCFVAGLIKTINTVKYTISSGAPSDKVSVFAAVVLILSCIGMGFYAAACVSFGIKMVGISMACSLVSCLLFAILIFQYRSRMRALGAYANR